MTEEARKYLHDIYRAITLIESFTNEIQDFDAYTADIKTQSATERQLSIIGEALKKVKKVFGYFY